MANLREKVEIPDKLKMLYESHPYKVAYSGRGGCKSWSYARALLVLGTERRVRVLCARETQKSIKDSVHKLLADQIRDNGLQDHYEIQEAQIIGKNGTQFFFAGLKHNIRNIKSIEGCDIVWVEEGQSVSEDSWETLIPTIRKEGSEIWVSFNPELETDNTYKRWILNPPDGAVVVKLSWRDNKWITNGMLKKMEHLRNSDPDMYQHVYEGTCRSTVEGAIYKEEIVRAEKDGRICKVPYDPSKPVETFWDLGYSDLVCIWFVQSMPLGFRVIDYYQNSSEAIDHYLQVMQAKSYTYGNCVLPWDGGTKHVQTGRSIGDTMRAKGFKVKIVGQSSVAQGINAVRTIFPMLHFDGIKCEKGLLGLRRYQWGPQPKSGALKQEPLHDIASHPSDALRTMAMHVQEYKEEAKTPSKLIENISSQRVNPSLQWMA